MNNAEPYHLIANLTTPAAPTQAAELLLPRRRRGRRPIPIPQETIDEILHLNEFYSARQISPRVGLSRKQVGRVLEANGLSPTPQKSCPQQSKDISKLEPFREAIAQRVRKKLTTTRILREIREVGYRGGRSILGDYVRELRSQLTLESASCVKRRFETDEGQDYEPLLAMRSRRSPRPIEQGNSPMSALAPRCTSAHCDLSRPVKGTAAPRAPGDLQASEPGEQVLVLPPTADGWSREIHLGPCALKHSSLGCDAGASVDFGGSPDVFMSEEVADVDRMDAGFQEMHGLRMPQAMRTDPVTDQECRLLLLGGARMLLQQVA